VTAVIQLIEAYKSSLALAAAPVLTVMGGAILWRAGRPRNADAEPPRVFVPAPHPPGSEPAAGSTAAGSAGEPTPDEKPIGLAKIAAGTFLLTISNPATLFGFIAFFSWLGVGADHIPGWIDSAFITLGVFTGASAWWLSLCFSVHLFRDRAARFVWVVDYLCGVLLLLGACLAVYEAWPGLPFLWSAVRGG
jgi:hypothetical protein